MSQQEWLQQNNAGRRGKTLPLTELLVNRGDIFATGGEDNEQLWVANLTDGTFSPDGADVNYVSALPLNTQGEFPWIVPVKHRLSPKSVATVIGLVPQPEVEAVLQVASSDYEVITV